MEVTQHTHHTGDVLTDGKTYFKVACANGFINIKELQMAGKKRMLVEEFLRGFKTENNLRFL